MYSASDVSRLAGAPLRSVRYWALTRVLEAVPSSDRAGTGHHRQFSREEVIIACIVQYFSTKGLQVGQLTKISKTLREEIFTDDVSVGYLNSAIRDEFKVFMIVPDAGWITFFGRGITDKVDKETRIFSDKEKVAGMLIRGPADAVDQEVAGIFRWVTNENPGFIALLLNGCFSRLRSEWHKQ